MRSPARQLTFSATLEKSKSKLWGSQIRVPKDAVSKLIEKSSRRVFCSLNGEPEYQCALLPVGNATYVISVNRNLLKALRLSVGQKVTVGLRKDESQYGLPMPEEFAELLRQDKEGDRLIHALTPAKLRTLLYIAGRGKDADQRIERSIIIVRHLKENAGKINYRQLGEMLRKGIAK